MTDKKKRFAVGIGAIGLLAAIWFALLPAGIMMGDDLRMVYDAQHGGYGSSVASALFSAKFNIYRPVLFLIFTLIVPIFGSNFALYQVLNVIVELCSTLLIAVIAYRLSRSSTLVSLSIGFAFAFSRLAYYAIGQVFGLMEGLALLLTLLLVLDVIEAYRHRRSERLLRGALWFGIALFVDERYVVVAPFVFFAMLFFFESRTERRVWLFCSVPVAFVLLNVAIKTFALHSHFLTATGQPIVFHSDTMARFLMSGFLNVIGFNVGPAYLSGADINDVGLPGYFVGLLVAIPFVVAAVALARVLVPANPAERRVPQTCVSLWALLFVPLLLSASLNFRQELRWLYGPYAVALMGLAAAAGYFATRRAFVNLCSICLVVGTLGSALLYRMYVGNVYFVYSESIAEQVDRIAAQRPSNPVIILTHGDTTLQGWTFMGQEFFDEFGLARGNVTYLNTPADIAKLAFPPTPPPTVIDVQGTSVAELEATGIRSASKSGGQGQLLSFINAYPNGVINSLAPASTPTGRGVFINTWTSPAGPVPSLTVLATYRYLYSRLPIRAHERLTFTIAAPYAMGSGSHAFVDVKAGSTVSRIYDEDLPPASDTGPVWQQQSIGLDKYAGKIVSIVFGTDVRDKNPVAAWAAFGTPSLVVGGR